LRASAQSRSTLPKLTIAILKFSGLGQGLSEAGYAEGQNVMVEYHWLEGHYERLPAMVADLVERRVAVIATPGSQPAAVSVLGFLPPRSMIRNEGVLGGSTLAAYHFLIHIEIFFPSMCYS
jgi:hypothetical protein